MQLISSCHNVHCHNLLRFIQLTLRQMSKGKKKTEMGTETKQSSFDLRINLKSFHIRLINVILNLCHFVTLTAFILSILWALQYCVVNGPSIRWHTHRLTVQKLVKIKYLVKFNENLFGLKQNRRRGTSI